MYASTRLVSSPLGWTVLIGVWLVAAMVVAGALALAGTAGGWLEYLLPWSGLTLIWAFGCPAIYRLIVRWPFTRQPVRAVLAHALLATLIVFGSLATLFALMRVMVGMSWSYPLAVAPWALAINFGKYTVITGILSALYSERRRRATAFSAERHARRAALLSAQLNSARLENLRSQINPHFLFNALNSIAALVHRRRTDVACQAISQLADLLRTALVRTNDELVPLRQELDFALAYLEIEKLRFRERIRTQIDVEEGAAEVRLPPLTLQPLIENAVRHAVERIETPVSIDIRAYVEAGCLRVVVEDDGPGYDSSLPGLGIGLSNVRQRLETAYGGSASIRLRRLNRRTQVELRLPATAAIALPTAVM